MRSLVLEVINFFKAPLQDKQSPITEIKSANCFQESNEDFLRTLAHHDKKVLATALAYVSRYQMLSELSEKGEEIDMAKLTDEMIHTANHNLKELVDHLHEEFQEDITSVREININIIH